MAERKDAKTPKQEEPEMQIESLSEDDLESVAGGLRKIAPGGDNTGTGTCNSGTGTCNAV